MEMKENSQKKVLLSVLGVAILVVAVIGISFALYSNSFKTDNNSISTGTIMVSYAESTNAINIEDALPISDEAGVAQTGNNKSFNFSVSTKATGALTVPYTITLTNVSTKEDGKFLTDSEVKVHLLKEGTAVVDKKYVNDLEDATGTFAGSKILYTTQDSFAAGNTDSKTTNYTLKMWISSEVQVDNNNSKEYKAKVNVDSSVKPVGQS